MKSSQLLLKSMARGFTLLELLLASAMTFIVVTLTGIAVAQVIQGNLQTRADSQIQYNTNRATEYIADEIRKASTIETDVTADFNRLKITNASNPNFDQQMTPVLILTIPDAREQVVYYTIPRSRVDSGSMYTDHRGWLVGKPDSLVVYRWGYDRTRESAVTSDPLEWKPQPILDSVDSATTTSICGRDPTDIFNSSATLNRLPVTAQGFSACVADSKKFAELHLKVSYQETNDGVTEKPIQYEVDTQVAARASGPFSVTITTITLLSAGTLNIEPGGEIPENSYLTSDSLGRVSINGNTSIPISNNAIGDPVQITLVNGTNRISSSMTSQSNARAYYNRSTIPSTIASSIPSSWKDPTNPSVFKLNINQVIISLNNTYYKFTLE